MEIIMDNENNSNNKKKCECSCSRCSCVCIQMVDDNTSKLLLDKFPDTSPYDFDYEQSGIWSPLVVPKHAYEITASMLIERLEATKKLKRKGSVNVKRRLRYNNSKRSLTPKGPPKRLSRYRGGYGDGWSRVLRVASWCFKSRPSLNSSLSLIPLQSK